MKTTNKFITWFGGLALLILTMTSCEDELDGTTYFTTDEMTIMQTLEANPEKFSMYVEMIKKADLFNALKSYGNYTCFAPNNEAVKTYISDKWGVTSVDQLNTPEQIEFLKTLVRFHTTPVGRATSSFIEGRLPDTTFTGDFITTSYLAGGGIANIKINREVGLDKYDIRTNNGIIHGLTGVLEPYVNSVPKVMEDRGEHTIFVEAMKKTGYYDVFDELLRPDGSKNNFTIFAESDEVYAQEGINSFADLVARVSPNEPDFEDPLNALNRYVAYHATQTFMYSTDIPEDGFINTVLPKNAIKAFKTDKFLKLNETEEGVNDTWTSLIYADSNYPAKNGVYHTVDKLFTIFTPKPKHIFFDFTSDQPEIQSKEIGGQSDYRGPDAYEFIRWEPASQEQRHLTQGNRVNLNRNVFSVHSYSWMEFDTPVIPRGKYEMLIVGNMSRRGRGAVQIYWDGEPLGKVWDMNSVRNTGWPDATQMELNGFRLGYDWITNNAGTSQAELESNSRFLITDELLCSEQKRHVLRLETVRSGVTPLDFVEFIPVEE
ncbi:hypothetical protein AXE80_03540 [Wenyingzhuangia fucanilytica]|uniref:FAS1 domain-containing protein n=1 Tax=Wenyingzhuangia fucanilytica TaxID=1790137 RepID=A0A1B1Y3T5_9FLAO|nr:fasciclin domain-containing protein [Wenyingzhuangia fucanilytica]ANW95407.1 hypothetical protein AXE80_03540 [Wenyingzhuangia fucanilytica]